MIWTPRKSAKSLRMLLLHSRPHRRLLVRGLAATVGIVLCRLAMPWPLRGFIDLILPADQRGGIVQDLLPGQDDQILWLAVAYVLLAAGLGLSELIQRVAMKTFAARTVHDMRAAAIRSLVSARDGAEGTRSAELVTRLVSDVARIKAEVSGILVHVTQNGLLFSGVCVVFLFLSPRLGLFFLIGGMIALGIGIKASTPVAASASSQRKREASYAVMIEDSLEHGELSSSLDDVNRRSARADARTTRLIAVSTLLVHVALAIVIAAALAFAVADVRAGVLLPGDLFLFIAYALTVHRRMVQVGRQTARAGKAFTHIRRVAGLIDVGVRARPATPSQTPTAPLRLEAVRLKSARGATARARLKQIDLVIEAGTHVAVLGESGAGKSSLLSILCGRVSPDGGRLLRGEVQVDPGSFEVRTAIGYLPQHPIFKPISAWRLLGLSGPEALEPQHEDLLRRLGGWRLIQSLPRGLAQKIAVNQMTRNEARALRLAAILGGSQSMWCLDAPLEGLDRRAASRRLKAILERAGSRTVIIGMTEPIRISGFDRVVVLRHGRICFDGSLAAWRDWRHQPTTSRADERPAGVEGTENPESRS